MNNETVWKTLSSIDVNNKTEGGQPYIPVMGMGMG